MSRYYRSFLEESTAPISYLLDTYGGASSAYSLRKLSTAYSGSAIRVRRSSDNTEQNIGFSGADLDTSSLLSFVGANNGFVTTWYDQSGTNNAIQTTASNQPQIVTSGSINILNGKTAINFDRDLSKYLYVNSTSVLNIQECISTFSVANFTNTGGNYGHIVSKGYGIDGAYSLGQQSDGSNYLQVVIETESFPLSTVVTNKNQQYLFSNTNATEANNIKLYQNNVIYGQATTSQDLTGSNSYQFNIGRNNRDNSYYINGNIQEIVLYPTYQQTNLTAINTNINTYYAIY